MVINEKCKKDLYKAMRKILITVRYDSILGFNEMIEYSTEVIIETINRNSGKRISQDAHK